METVNLKQLHRNELEEACFTQDAAYSNSTDLAKRTVSDKILKDRILWNCLKPWIW